MLPRALLLLIIVAIAIAGWGATFALWKFRRAETEIGLLAPRQFEEPTLVTVGTGGPTENPSRSGPAIALGYASRIVLVDAGRGVAEALRSAKIPPSQPDTVYLSSLLPENVLGLDDLLVSGWRSGRTRPLRMVGPAGSESLARSLEAAQRPLLAGLAQQLGTDLGGAAFRVVEVAAELSEEAGGISVRARALPGGALPALAFRFELGRRSAVVGSVGFGSDTLGELAAGAGTLVHGAVFMAAVDAAVEAGADQPERLRREAALQLPLRELARVARRSGVGRLVLVRLSPPPLFDFQFERVVGESYRREVVVAEDGQEITL